MLHRVLAYIDPGAGSLLVQAVIAALVSVPFFFRRSIASVMSRLRGSAEPQPAEKTTASDTEG
jgi:hypothetical protein